MKKKLGFIILIIATGFVFYSFLSLESEDKNASHFFKFMNSFKHLPKPGESAQLQDIRNSKNAQTLPENLSPNEVLAEWVKGEAQNIEISSANPDLSEKNYIEKVKKFSLEEIYKIQQMALESERPANEKIFASYILSLSVETAHLAPLEDFVLKPLIQRGEIRPHTQDELERTQELALKYMQIDRLYEKAKGKDLPALESLKKIARLADIEQIRNYAQQKIALILNK